MRIQLIERKKVTAAATKKSTVKEVASSSAHSPLDGELLAAKKIEETNN